MTKEDIYEQMIAIKFKIDDIGSNCSNLGMSWSIIEMLQNLAVRVEDAAIDCRFAHCLDDDEPEFEADD